MVPVICVGNNGVGVRLQTDCPYLIHVHCAAHRVALVASNAARDTQKVADCRRVLNNMHFYFKNSAQWYERLRELHRAFEESDFISLKKTLLCSLVELHQGFGECLHQLGSAGDGAGSVWPEQPHCWRHLTSAEGLLVCSFNAHAAGCPASHWPTQQVFSGGKRQRVHHQTQSGNCTWQTDWTAEWAWRQRKGIQRPTKQLQRPQLSSLWHSQCQSLHHHEGFLSGELDWQHGQPSSTGWHDHPQRAWRHFWHENVSIPKPSTTCHCCTGNHPWTVFSWWHGQSADWTKQNMMSFFRV